MAIMPREMKEMEKLMDSMPREMERFLYSLVGDVEMVLDFLEEMEKMLLPPARSYVKNTKAMFRTPADVYEHPDSYHFVLDMPGLQVENIKVISYQPPLSNSAHVYVSVFCFVTWLIAWS